ncbi:MAG: hypothetical protein U9P07_06695 [Pseudomonadota bacterium]|nr:hypothetical protein [Pseudomonadota bacterium]
MELVLGKTFTSMTPIFMSGHKGDPNWISGFHATGDVTLDGTKIGTASATIMHVSPPMRLTEEYDTLFMQVVNSITGVGTFEVTGIGISSGSSTTTTTGDVLLAWYGSISNGTDSLADTYGLSSGVVIGNVYTGQGEGKETIRIRFGY